MLKMIGKLNKMTITLSTIYFLATVSIDLVLGYKSMTVENGELCSPITKRKIKLGKNENSGLIVRQKRLNDHPLEWDIDFKCTFQVETSSNDNGVFAVIQKLVFRRNEETGECIDYIQFRRQDRLPSKKYCGYLTTELGMGKHFAHFESSDISPAGNSFVGAGGHLDVIIFVSKEPLIGGEETDLSIVFTSYKTCSLSKGNQLFPCSTEQKAKCIFGGFYKDELVNCPYPECVDEEGCSEEGSIPGKQSSGNVVLISSLSTLAALFCIFIIGVYLCRKYSKLCWSQEFSRAMEGDRRANSGGEAGTSPPSTATVAEGRVASGQAAHLEEDKDLPPSYESLFPDR